MFPFILLLVVSLQYVQSVDKLLVSNSSLNGIWSPMHTTASGRWCYGYRMYSLYYDPDCSSDGMLPGGWFLDDTSPGQTALNDLDNDNTCSASAFIPTVEVIPPQGEWNVMCGGSWEKNQLTIEQTSVIMCGPGEGKLQPERSQPEQLLLKHVRELRNDRIPP